MSEITTSVLNISKGAENNIRVRNDCLQFKGVQKYKKEEKKEGREGGKKRKEWRKEGLKEELKEGSKEGKKEDDV